MTEPGPLGPDTRVTHGWLLRRGYTVVSCGWQHHVPRGGGTLFGLRVNGPANAGAVYVSTLPFSIGTKTPPGTTKGDFAFEA